MSKSVSHKEKVESAYDGAASEYDTLTVDRMSSSTYRLLRDLDIPSDPVGLDVGCGTGISTFKMMELCDVCGTFHGIDISQGMIDEAAKIASKSGYSNVSFKKGDAESLEFPDDSFDIVISNMVLHWVPNKRQAFSEIFRVLKPGGQFAVVFNGNLNNIEIYSMGKKFESENPEIAGGSTVMGDMISYQLSLEDTHNLADEIGFVDIELYEKRSFRYVTRDSGLAKHYDVTAAWWKEGLSAETVEKANGFMMMEMARNSTPRGFKTTLQDIFAYGKKPV